MNEEDKLSDQERERFAHILPYLERLKTQEPIRIGSPEYEIWLENLATDLSKFTD